MSAEGAQTSRVVPPGAPFRSGDFQGSLCPYFVAHLMAPIGQWHVILSVAAVATQPVTAPKSLNHTRAGDVEKQTPETN